MRLGHTQSYLVQQSAIDAIPPFAECFLPADNVLGFRDGLKRCGSCPHGAFYLQRDAGVAQTDT